MFGCVVVLYVQALCFHSRQKEWAEGPKGWMLAKFVPFKSPFNTCAYNSLTRIGSHGPPSTIHQKVARRRGLGSGGWLANRQLLAEEFFRKMHETKIFGVSFSGGFSLVQNDNSLFSL